MSQARRILGALIAGGASRRFGTDKALALINGRPLLAHVADALRPQVDALVVCGRAWPGERALPDLREGGLGPLAGLETALDYARCHDFDAVITVPVDTLPLPDDLVERLGGERAAVLGSQHLIGCWPCEYLEALSMFLSRGHSDVRGWILEAQARRVAEPHWIGNVNFAHELDELRARLMA